jgi:Rps23 Pro-64 3,4-dihydroxylase Tpa1-like proline 4-hydroxylase
MSHRKIEMKCGKQIHVFDDLFSYADRSRWYVDGSTGYFSPNGGDTLFLESKGNFNLFRPLSGTQDFDKMNILAHENAAPILELLGDVELYQARINLSTLNDKNRFHSDSGHYPVVTLLYYLNIEWHMEWGGYTLFGDDQQTEIEEVVSYKPGRVVVFDGSIPHCIAAPTNLAPTYRFSLAMQFVKIGTTEKMKRPYGTEEQSDQS